MRGSKSAPVIAMTQGVSAVRRGPGRGHSSGAAPRPLPTRGGAAAGQHERVEERSEIGPAGNETDQERAIDGLAVELDHPLRREAEVRRHSAEVWSVVDNRYAVEAAGLLHGRAPGRETADRGRERPVRDLVRVELPRHAGVAAPRLADLAAPPPPRSQPPAP